MNGGLVVLSFRTSVLAALLCCVRAMAAQSAGIQTPQRPAVTIIAGGESQLSAAAYRKMIVGPGVNQPDPFPGYQGFVSWECPVRLRDGTMLRQLQRWLLACLSSDADLTKR